MDEEGIRATALGQHGVVARRQVLALGGTDMVIAGRLRSGQWRRARPGVFVIGAAPHTWEQDLMAAWLAAGPHTFAFDRSALRLWGLVARSGRIQLVTEGDRRIVLPDIDVHRTNCLPRADRSAVGAIAVTSVARTLVDASAGQSPLVVGRWVDDAMRRLGLDLTDLEACVDRLAVPGRRAHPEIRVALAERAPGYQPGHSQLEAEAMLAIIRARLPLPVQQHRVVRPDGTPAFIDLAYPAQMVAIEVDGFDPHAGRVPFDNDRARENDLVLLGWKVLHFTSTTHPATFVRTLAAALALA